MITMSMPRMTARTLSFHSDQFTWSPKYKTLVAELSDLQIRGPMPSLIAIKSALTGNEKSFGYERTIRDFEGDVVVWVYSERDIGLEVHILND